MANLANAGLASKHPDYIEAGDPDRFIYEQETIHILLRFSMGVTTAVIGPGGGFGFSRLWGHDKFNVVMLNDK